MGVPGLWQILSPTARPIRLETLNRKRLAVDASIWIYQFLKAVRDKEGNALRNSHVIGFFQRICKLLYFGIQPVFVFDGGAPVLKRQTVGERKKRREGRRDDAVRTAGKLLAVQMQRAAEGEAAAAAADKRGGWEDEGEEVVPEGEALVYADELQMGADERRQARKFKKTDAYHLPEMEGGMAAGRQGDDARIMSLEELQAYARQFEAGEDINVYDFSKIDYDSAFFTSLPATDRYNILNAARLRSRLRMGQTKEQLDERFPDRMEFSKFQIARALERSELTQRLMHVNEGGDAEFQNGGRVAGEKGREYVLVKNDGVEGGWALGVMPVEGTREENAIDLDEPEPKPKVEEEEEDEGFEDVPVEGLNRLPKVRRRSGDGADALSEQRRAFYKSRKSAGKRKSKKQNDGNSLFVGQEPEEEGDEEWEAVDGHDDLFGEADDQNGEENEELQRAIAMSLQQDGSPPNQAEASQPTKAASAASDDDNDMLEVFQQTSVPAAQPIPKGGGRALASLVNKRAFDTAPESHEVTSFGVPAPKPDTNSDASSSDDDAMDLQAALAESRKNKRKTSPPPRHRPSSSSKPRDEAREIAQKAGFSGPLPFEKLDLGSSLLGRKKMQERSDAAAGGFENPEVARAEAESKKAQEALPLPPWFSGDVEEDLKRQEVLESEGREQAREAERERRMRFQRRDEGIFEMGREGEVVDLDADEEVGGFGKGEVIDLEAEEGLELSKEKDVIDLEADDTGEEQRGSGTMRLDTGLRMGDAAEKMRVEPPEGDVENHRQAVSQSALGAAEPKEDEVDRKHASESTRMQTKFPSQNIQANEDVDVGDLEQKLPKQKSASPAAANEPVPATSTKHDDEVLDWSESEDGREEPAKPSNVTQPEPTANSVEPARSEACKSPSPEFEDVDVSRSNVPAAQKGDAKSLSPALEEVDVQGGTAQPRDESEGPVPASGSAPQDITMADMDDAEQADFDDFDDPEEEEMLRQLTLEAEEHARFASTLNNKSQAQNIADYETELKQLRNQQKKDRRDADEVTQVMINECQQLLRLFGLPYVTAPMEAEAQCAELVTLGLVDGIVTDDSDCFLFGGTRIYKNMFNSAKFVECYLASDLEKEFALTRDKMIAAAHLLGSDYTEGLPGVGPVTALEILSEFPSLAAFRDWWTAVQSNTIPKAADAQNPFRKKFRRNATKLFLPPIFPDPRVDAAYTDPEIDADPQPFQWGVPDLEALRSFLMATVGWSPERTDEVLVPVIRDMNRRADEGTQSNITAFFDGGVGVGSAGQGQGGEGFAPRKRVVGSKRMGSALSRLAERGKGERGAGVVAVDVEGGEEGVAENGARKRKAGKGKEAAGNDEDGANADAAKGAKKRKARKTKSTPAGEDGDASEDGASAYEEPRQDKRKRRKGKAPAGGRRKEAKADEA